MFGLLKSVAELAIDVSAVVIAPVEVAVDLAAIVVKPVAGVAKTISSDINSLKD